MLRRRDFVTASALGLVPGALKGGVSLDSRTARSALALTAARVV